MVLLAFFCLAALLAAGCQPLALPARPLPDGEGALHLYVQPFPQEAQRLRFRLAAVSAVRADGGAVPLPLALAEFSEPELRRQRQLAASSLPPGEYLGLSFLMESAFLQGEEGEATLAVPEEPRLVEFPFRIEREEALLLLLKFNPRQALEGGGVVFSPAFSIFLPERLACKLRGYVVNERANSITILDKNRLQVAAVLATGQGPRDLALDRSRARAYVPLAGEDTLLLLDMGGQEIIDRLRLPMGDEPVAAALTPDGDLLVIANFGSDTVMLAEAASLIETARIPVGDGPCAVEIDKGGRRAYVLNRWAGTVSVLDLGSRLLAATIPVDPQPLAAAMSSDGERLFVVHAEAPHLTVIDTRTLAVSERALVGGGMGGLVLDPRTELLYLARSEEGLVEIYDPEALFSVGAIRVGETVGDLAIDGEEGNLFVALPEKGSLAVYDLLSRRLAALIEVGAGPRAITLLGDR